MTQTVSGQTPGVPPGAKTVRVPGSHEAVAPLHYDPVGPWGESNPHGDPGKCAGRPAHMSMPCKQLPCLALVASDGRWRGTGHPILQMKRFGDLCVLPWLQGSHQGRAVARQTLSACRGGTRARLPRQRCCTAWHPCRPGTSLLSACLGRRSAPSTSELRCAQPGNVCPPQPIWDQAKQFVI